MKRDLQRLQNTLKACNLYFSMRPNGGIWVTASRLRPGVTYPSLTPFPFLNDTYRPGSVGVEFRTSELTGPASVCHDSNLIEDCSNLPIAYPVVWCFLLSQHPRYLSSHQIVTYMEAISQKREGAQEPPEEYVHCLITNSRIQPIWKLPDLTNYFGNWNTAPTFPRKNSVVVKFNFTNIFGTCWSPDSALYNN